MENNILPPSRSSDTTLFAMTSRKRKSSNIDVPRPASEFHLPSKSSLKEFGSFSGANGQGNAPGVCLNQTISFGPETLRPQFQSNQYYQHNDFEEARFTSGTLSTMPHSSKFREPSSLLKMPAGEIPAQNFTSLTREIGGQTEPQRSLTIKRLHSNNGNKDHIFPDRGMGMCNVPTEFMRAEGMSSKCSLPDGSCDDYQTGACSEGANEFENSFQLRQSGQFPNNGGTVKFPYEQVDSIGASSFAEQMEEQSSLQSKIQGIGSSPIIPLDANSESRGAHGESGFKHQSKAASKKLEASVTDEVLCKNRNKVGNGVEHGQSNKLNQDFDKLNGKSISPGKTTSMAAEKLWEGSLQLNSSITVSAVAFFKSGEKLLDVNWSEIVEVKGKVRLEAFEKYIQDLPRSRSRGLMVISLCWKEGSSKSGLKGMKEVAKGYQKGERVGLARLSPGVDVYLCPRFFKGKAAVEDNSELLIGCVVWRKNQTSAGSTAKRSENKGKSLQEQLLKSPSDTSSNQKAGGVSSSIVPPIQKSLASVESSSVVENVSVTESKNFDIGKPISSRNLLPTPSVSKVSSIPVGQQISSYSTLPIEGSKGHPLEIGAASARGSEAGFPKASLELPESNTSVPSNVLNEGIRRADVDDLPEYDFGNTDEISLTSVSKPLDASAFNKKLQHVGNKNSDVKMPPMMPATHSVSVSDTGSSNSSVHRLSLTSNQEIPVCKSIADHEKQILLRQKNDGNHSLQTDSPDSVAVGSCTFTSTKIAFDRFGKKNLFDNDDDIPEWIPPKLEKPSSPEAKEPSLTIPSESSNSSSQSLPMGTSRQPHPPPFLAASLPECASQAFRPFYRPPPNLKTLPPSSAEAKEPSLTICSESSNSSFQSLPLGTSRQPHPPFPAASLPECASQAFRPFYRPPPNLKILPPSSAEAKEPSLTIPSKSSNSSSQSLPLGSSQQPHPSPFPAASLPECSSHRPFYRPPPNVKILPPIPSQHGSSSLTGFTFTPLLRPPSSSPAIQRPLLPANKWGSRP